jgi:hypothetical protein
MKTNSPLAVWSLILGILAIISCGPVSGIPAIICGHMARSKIKMEPDTLTGDGMALAGLIMGYFSIVVVILAIAGILIAIMAPAMIKMFQHLQNGSAQPACNIIINMLTSLT